MRKLGIAAWIVKPGHPNFTLADVLTEGGIPCRDNPFHYVLVSINTGCVLKIDLRTGQVIARLDLQKAVGVAHAGGIEYHENGGYIVMGSQCLIYVNADLTEARIVKHLQCRPGTRLNDGTATPNGGLVTGSLDFRFDASLLLSEQHGKVHNVMSTGIEFPLVDRIGLSNGLIFNGAGDTAFHVDSFSSTLFSWEFKWQSQTFGERKPCSGDLLEGRGFTKDKPKEMALLDGLGATEEGLIIIARWGRGDIVFFDPTTQQIVGQVLMPEGFAHPTHAALGGETGKDLLICTEQGPQSADGAFGLFHARIPDDFAATARKKPFTCKFAV